MSFTIVTNVFCDRCNNWDSQTGGAICESAWRTEAWRLAKSKGWKKIKGQHICAMCRLGDLAEEIATLELSESGKFSANKKKTRAKIEKLSREYAKIIKISD